MKYENLNRIVQDYEVSKERGIRDLFTLKKSLFNVPINISRFEKYLLDNFNAFPSELITRAELYTPDVRIPLLNELSAFYPRGNIIKRNMISGKRAEDITEKVVAPYPVISMSGENLSNKFYNKTRSNLKLLFSRGKKNKTTRMFVHPLGNAMGIVYKDSRENMHYLEIMITRDKF